MDKVVVKKYIGLISNIFLVCIVFGYMLLIFQMRQQFSFALLAVLMGLGLIAIVMLLKSISGIKNNVKNT